MYKIGKMFALAALFVVASAQASDKQTVVQRATGAVSSAAGSAYKSCKSGLCSIQEFAVNYLWNLGYSKEQIDKMVADKNWTPALLKAYKFAVAAAAVSYVGYKIYTNVCGDQEDSCSKYTAERA